MCSKVCWGRGVDKLTYVQSSDEFGNKNVERIDPMLKAPIALQIVV